MEITPPGGVALQPSAGLTSRDRVSDPLQAAAARLEASFLSEMLKAAGVGEARGTFGGGIGEEQFASMLRDQIAQQMTAAGGIGMSQTIFHALTAADDARR